MPKPQSSAPARYTEEAKKLLPLWILHPKREQLIATITEALVQAEERGRSGRTEG